MTTTLRILTLVARAPHFGAWSDGDAEPALAGKALAIREGDPDIADIVSLLRARADKQTHAYYRATTSEDVRSAILQVGGASPLDLIQIIGHGAAGRLSLGARWTQDPRDPALHYHIDSDPHVYGPISIESATHAETRIVLFGCDVGLGRPTTHAIDGVTLVFALARRWGCSVFAPVDTVGADGLDAQGVVKGLALRADAFSWSDGRDVHEGRGGDHPRGQGSTSASLTIGTTRAISERRRAELTATTWRETPNPRILAAPIAVGVLTLPDGSDRMVELVHDGHLARTRVPGGDYTYYAPS